MVNIIQIIVSGLALAAIIFKIVIDWQRKEPVEESLHLPMHLVNFDESIDKDIHLKDHTWSLTTQVPGGPRIHIAIVQEGDTRRVYLDGDDGSVTANIMLFSRCLTQEELGKLGKSYSLHDEEDKLGT